MVNDRSGSTIVLTISGDMIEILVWIGTFPFVSFGTQRLPNGR